MNIKNGLKQMKRKESGLIFPGLNNWKLVEMQRYVDALLRHTLAFVEDPESLDEESGLAHYKHMACNMAFICEMMEGKNA